MAQVRPAADRPRANVGELAQRALLDAYAPASVLANRKHQGLYYFGPTDLYLKMPAGVASQDLLAAAREGLRPAIRAAFDKAGQPAVGHRRPGDARRPRVAVTVTAQIVKHDDEELVLLSFRRPAGDTNQTSKRWSSRWPTPRGLTRTEQELDATRKELEDAIRDRETAEEEIRAINEEAMSVSEEFQTTNEELETSREELQSLNEELTALNSQLQETLEPASGRRERPREHSEQRRRRDPVPRRKSPHPLLHPGGESAVQRDHLRRRPPARRSGAAFRRRASAGRCKAGARQSRADHARDRGGERRLVHLPHPAVPDQG